MDMGVTVVIQPAEAIDGKSMIEVVFDLTAGCLHIEIEIKL